MFSMFNGRVNTICNVRRVYYGSLIEYNSTPIPAYQPNAMSDFSSELLIHCAQEDGEETCFNGFMFRFQKYRDCIHNLTVEREGDALKISYNASGDGFYSCIIKFEDRAKLENLVSIILKLNASLRRFSAKSFTGQKLTTMRHYVEGLLRSLEFSLPKRELRNCDDKMLQQEFDVTLEMMGYIFEEAIECINDIMFQSNQPSSAQNSNNDRADDKKDYTSSTPAMSSSSN